MSGITIDLDQHSIDKIVEGINKGGFYCIKDAISADQIKLFEKEILRLLKNKGNRYFSLINPANIENSIFSAIRHNKNLVTLLNKLSSIALNRNVKESENLSVLRVITGKDADSQTLKFHYDAYALTALIPVIIPKGNIDESGHLVAFTNSRQLRKLQITNLLEKIILQNPIARTLLSYVVSSNQDKYVRIMLPGNIYLFWGYRTLHANYSVREDYLRSTILFHFGDVHFDSLSDKLIKKIRHKYEKDKSNDK